jgi:quercetin dioxygenase-like cupin family protein
MIMRIWALLLFFSVTAATFFNGCDASAQICKPVNERTGEVGCWITANTDLGHLPREPIFWHLYTFATKAEANAAKGPYGTVVESLGKVWLFTIEVERWRLSVGTHVSVVGPLPVKTNISYSAQYMEAIFTPGMTAPTHRHSGPEAWYTISGETCLETPEGEFIGRAGGPPVIVRGGLPMHLTAIGKETRRALVLILHDSEKEPTTPAKDWIPIGLCRE